jgi:eukaryotic-like serine/threonine-protein kinase
MSEVKCDAKAIFLEALDCKGADELMCFLERTCGTDAALRTRVEELLRAHQEAGAFLGGAGKQSGTCDLPPTQRLGTVIGPYKLLQQIGEGGMGTVYMAEQTQPVQRKVALKVIKPGMDSRQVIARFEAERQALAMMDHVNIARVFDGGTTEGGRPYFVMELVHGVPITKYCDDHHLTPRERLELFVPVCQAIQHAHQKGIIHRDIKPSNVMITLYDGKPVPKVIDFGVAKATEQKLTERTLFTQYGTMVGTLEYMSPEQAEMSALGVDTRSDIYSLGVLLYELLTGNTPLSHKTMKEAAYAEILRMIKEEEPPKPSTRLSDSGEALASISANRHMEPAKLTKLVRGELDWIVMKTLEKDRNRRYETANGFAADVQRYLNDEPVQACPPAAWYRFRKFARRNRAAIVTAGLVMLALLLGTAISTWQAIRATTAEREAEANLLNAHEAVDQMLTRVSEERLKDVPQAYPIRKGLLEDALKFYEGFLRQQPSDPQLRVKQARVLRSLASLQFRMRRLGDADLSFRRAVDIAEKLVAENPSDADYRSTLAQNYESLAFSLSMRDQHQQSEAEYRRALTLWSDLSRESSDNEEYRSKLGRCQWILAGALARAGNATALDEAEALVRQALATHRELMDKFSANHRHTQHLVQASVLLVELLVRRGRLAKAEECILETLPSVDKLIAQSGNQETPRQVYASFLKARGDLLWRLGRNKDAAATARKAVEMGQELVDDFPEIGSHQFLLANVLYTQIGMPHLKTQPKEAETAFRRALPIYEHLARLELDGFAHEWAPGSQTAFLQRRIIDCRMQLASILFATNRREEAEPIWRQAMAQAEKLARKDPKSGHLVHALLRVWPDAPAAEAERVNRAALPLLDWLAEQDPEQQLALANVLYSHIGVPQLKAQPKEAETAFRRALILYENLAKPESDSLSFVQGQMIRCRTHLTAILFATDRRAEAEPMWRLTMAMADKLVREEPRNGYLVHELLRAWPEAPAADAEPVYRAALPLLDWLAEQAPELAWHPWNASLYRKKVVLLLLDLGRPDEAEPYWRRTLKEVEAAIQKDPAQAPAWNPDLEQLTEALVRAGRSQEGKAIRPRLQNSRGVARYRAGDWTGAIAALNESMRLYGNLEESARAESSNTYFLAMAHWQLSEKETARKWYDQAVQWMEKNQPKNEELRRFRAEAEQLLGIDKKKN